MIDLHAHILPGMDDGAKDVQTSLALLGALQRQGVTCVAATPHLYLSRERAESFLARRANALQALADAASRSGDPLPAIIPGAEAALHPELLELDSLGQLCYQGTNYLLVEMPYDPWQSWMFDLLFELTAVHGVRPVIAHIDRYLFSSDIAFDLDGLLELGLPLQMNVSSYLRADRRRKLKKYIADGEIQLVGSDCHNMDRRPPQFDLFRQRLAKSGQLDFWGRAKTAAEQLLANEDVI